MDTRSPPSKKKKKRPAETPKKVQPNPEKLEVKPSSKVEESKEFTRSIQSILKKRTETPAEDTKKSDKEVEICPYITVEEYDFFPFVKAKMSKGKGEKLYEWKNKIRSICVCSLGPSSRNQHTVHLGLLYAVVHEAEAAENDSSVEAVKQAYQGLMTYVSYPLVDSGVLPEALSYINEELRNMSGTPEWKTIADDASCAINTILKLIRRQKRPDIDFDKIKTFDGWLDRLTDLTQYMGDVKEIVKKITQGEDENSKYSVADRMRQLDALKGSVDKRWLISLGGDSHLVEDIWECIRKLVEREPDDKKDLMRESYKLPLRYLETLNDWTEYKKMLDSHFESPVPPRRNSSGWSVSLFEPPVVPFLPALPQEGGVISASETPAPVCASPETPRRSPKGSIIG